MSLNKFSNQKNASSTDKPEDKSKGTPAVDAPVIVPVKMPDEAAPAQKP